MTEPQSEHNSEITRIRAEYARRERSVRPDFYGWNRDPNLFAHFEVVRACIRMLVRENAFPVDGRVILDVGCGRGTWLAEFLQWGADGDKICGIDLDDGRVQVAKKRHAAADLHAGDASRLPWADETFDLVTQFTLFTSILDSGVKQKIASEMLRVVKPSGIILWYDFRFNNPNNPKVRGIDATEIKSLFPGCLVDLHTVTLAPPLARRVVALSWIAGLIMERVPFLRTHYLGCIKKVR